MRVSFQGNIDEIPEIAVDNFEDTGKKAYFLSHCHKDHTNNLDNFHHKIRPNVYIYMSEPSAAIVKTYINKELGHHIKPLGLGRETITIPGDETTNHEDTYLEVTLIPASHCFGSVMFLFSTTFKKILYTGDFRISENSVSKMAQLHDVDEKPIKLDALYVDTTFQNATHQVFPKRSETIEYVVRAITEWINRGKKYRVALITGARYGYEYVFNNLYKEMKMKVFAGKSGDLGNWDLYSQFPNELYGVTDNDKTTRIHLCSTFKNYCPLKCINDNTNEYLKIRFTAMRWKNYEREDLAVERVSYDHLHVCFATHCSRSELIHFVEYLAPKKIVGFADPYIGVPEPVAITPNRRKLVEKSSSEKKMDSKRSKKVPEHVLRNLFDF